MAYCDTDRGRYVGRHGLFRQMLPDGGWQDGMGADEISPLLSASNGDVVGE